MSDMVDRRALLKGAAASAAGLTGAAGFKAEAAEALQFAEPAAFSYEGLKARAREMARGAYVGSPRPAPDVVQKINYEEWGKITFRTDHALFADGPGRFPVEFFHLGLFFQKAVDLHVVENGQSRKIIYDQSYFDMPADSIARRLPKGAGFAGFRIQESREGGLDWRKNDWVAFLGAAYFRSIGELRQYGLSSRGVALDIAVPDHPEEFPDFTNFYIDSNEGADNVVIHALMEGPSIVGAYRFDMTRGKGVVMDIEASLFMRAAVSRFGIAPLTSMYWFSETKKETATDWRPEVHDFGRAGDVERQRREALAPAQQSAAHHGLGVLRQQSARLRPAAARPRVRSLPGRCVLRPATQSVGGAVAWRARRGLGQGRDPAFEIPTNDEIHDNVVAMWVPEKPIPANAEVNLRYRLHWLADEPYPSKLGRCVATRLGNGGQAGLPRPKGVRKFMVEFLGGPLADLPVRRHARGGDQHLAGRIRLLQAGRSGA